MSLNKKKIGFLLFTLFLLLVFTEIFLSVVFYFKDEREEVIKVENVEDRPYLYYGFGENAKEGVNEDGLRNLKSVAKPKTAFRIILIGASVAEKLGSQKNDKGELILEKALKKYIDTPIEILNGAVSGYVAEQQFLSIQLLLRKYTPDMIVAIDGYNDLMTFKLNRHFNQTILLPPQNYRDFMVISKGKDESTFFYRFKALFRSTTRAAKFIKHYFAQKNQYDYSALTDADLDKVAESYASIINDTYVFCKANTIYYYDFLQPVRFYKSSGPDHLSEVKNEPALASLYSKFENKLSTQPYCTSLTKIFDNNLKVYIDDCHPYNENGITILAEELAKSLAAKMKADSLKINEN